MRSLIPIAGAALALLALAALPACESAANLDVSYAAHGSSDAASPSDGGGGGEGTADGAAGDASAAAAAQVFDGCPCDSTMGLGCCVPKNGAPFCTSDLGACAGADGAFLGCVRPNVDSACCWHQKVGGQGSVSTYAGACSDGGTPSCVADFECEGQPCTTTTCDGVVFGACGTTKPACP